MMKKKKLCSAKNRDLYKKHDPESSMNESRDKYIGSLIYTKLELVSRINKLSLIT